MTGYCVIEKDSQHDDGRTVDTIYDANELADWISKFGTHGKIYETAPFEFEDIQDDPKPTPKLGRVSKWFRTLFQKKSSI